MGDKEDESLARPESTLLPTMAAPSDITARPHSPYHDRVNTGTESLPNLNSPRLTSISDAPETIPRHFEYPPGWLSSKIGGYPLPPIQPTAARVNIEQQACTHCTMTRKFDNDSNDNCEICHRKSGFGWLYVCTEDHDGFLPPEEHTSTVHHEICEPDATGEASLSPWINKAIEDGHYSPKEIEILKLQRAEVKETISIARTPTPASSVTHISESSYAEDTDDEAWTETVEDISKPDTETEPKHSMSSIPKHQIDRTRMHMKSVCHIMCCHTCRPASCDRSWASLNAICNETTVKLPPPWDISNRRVSNTNVVRKLGLHGADINHSSSTNECLGSNGFLEQSSPPNRRERESAMDVEHRSIRLVNATSSARAELEEIGDPINTMEQLNQELHTQPMSLGDSEAPRRGGTYFIRRGRPFSESTSGQQSIAFRRKHMHTGCGTAFQTEPASSRSCRWSFDSESDSEVDVPGGVALTTKGVTPVTTDITME